uniref:Uncharacterized protein n=1 Tax=Myotis myotis TaxID=51298 RepID=A0A7J7Z5Q3_MYOMY|nr:hypothetical protein mMyoMyo1_010756 [Myotis myotis]
MGASTRCGDHPVFPVWAEITTTPSPLQPGPPPHQIPHRKGSRNGENSGAHQRQQTSRRCPEQTAGPNLLWPSVRDGNQCFSPGREARVLGPLEEGHWVWVNPAGLRKGWGPRGKKPGLGWQGHCLPGWMIAHVQLKPVQETNLHFIFLVGPFFFPDC